MQLQYGAISADYTVLQQAVLNQKGCVLASWDAPEDATTGARYDLRTVVEDVQLYIRRGCVPALIARSGKTGRRVLLTFDDPQKRRRAG